MTLEGPQGEVNVTIKSVEVNVDVADDMFSKPAAK